MIAHNWHANAKIENGILKEMHDTIRESLYRRISAAEEIGDILLLKHALLLRISENAPRSKIGNMNSILLSEKRENKGRIQIIANILYQLPLLLQIINGGISWAMGSPNQTKNTIRILGCEFCLYTRLIICSVSSLNHNVPLLSQKLYHHTPNPSVATINKPPHLLYHSQPGLSYDI